MEETFKHATCIFLQILSDFYNQDSSLLDKRKFYSSELRNLLLSPEGH